jgi:hypothetical protein
MGCVCAASFRGFGVINFERSFIFDHNAIILSRALD